MLNFDAFWESYPKRTGRIAASRQYQAAIYYMDATHEAIMVGVEAYKKHLASKQTSFEFIAAPAKWLAEGRWMDEYQTNLPKQSFNPNQVMVGETMSQARERLARKGLRLVP